MNAEAYLNYELKTAGIRSAIRRLILVNFRNYKYLKLNTLSPFIVLSGENGSGKTNILEAISFLSQGRGLRNAKLSEIKTFDFFATSQPTPVFINNNGWAVSAHIENDNDEYTIGTAVESITKETAYNETKEVERRIVHVNNQKLSSQNELGNYLSLIWVTPQMDRIFQGGAQHRRSFLDRIVYAFDTEHARRISVYDNLYRQWLQILKSGNIDSTWLNTLEQQLSEIGVAIAAARCEQINNLNLFIESNPDDTFPDAVLELDGTIEKMLTNKPAIYVEDFYCESLRQLRKSILYNDNVSGINKTDLKAIYKQKNAPANLCSTGEQKSLLLNIILAQAKSLISSKNSFPILLLDEIAAHLDDYKRDAFFVKIKNLNLQSWMTSTNPYDFATIGDMAQFFEIKNNTVNSISI